MPENRNDHVFSSNAKGPLSVSFEFFPPKTEAMEKNLWHAMERLSPLRPSFVSVTYGAGGSTRQRTHDTVTRIQNEGGLPCAAHLTCVGASRDEVNQIAQNYWNAGVRHLVALRGDPPEGQVEFQKHPDGYYNAAELVSGLLQLANFDISVAAYPEMHPDSPSSQADLDNLKRKIDAGANRAITQFFFDADTYLRFLERARAAGVWVPIVPGILPVSNFVQAARIAKSCGTVMPAWMAHLFEGLDDDIETRRMVAVTVAAEQCRKLRTAGVTDFHFYTLNRADLTYAICHILGFRPPYVGSGASSK